MQPITTDQELLRQLLLTENKAETLLSRIEQLIARADINQYIYITIAMNELEETRSLLHNACSMIQELVQLLKTEEENHRKDVADLYSHHVKEIQDLHELIKQSEARIDKTNEMIREMSHTTSEINTTNKDLKDSYLQQFERTNAQVSHLVEENNRLVKENEAYYNSLKREREHSREIMSSIIAQTFSTNRQPLVNIDQA